MNQEIYQIPPTVAHRYLIAGQSGYLLIDVGLPNEYDNLHKYLQGYGVSFDQIELIVITHADGDHFGCLSEVKHDNPSLVTAASEIEARAIESGKSSRPTKAKGILGIFYKVVSPMFQSKPAKIERILNVGEVLPFLGGLEVLDTQGHTPGHISLWSESTRTLFAGDSIKVRGKSLLPSSGGNTWDEALALQSFEMQIALKPDRIYAGHGVWLRD